MPFAPKRLNQKKPQKAWRTTTTSSTARGYGADWQKLRAAYKAEHPLCERCEAKGIIRETQEVHHKKAFKGIDDPLRLDWDNLEGLCKQCHSHETGSRKTGGGG